MPDGIPNEASIRWIGRGFARRAHSLWSRRWVRIAVVAFGIALLVVLQFLRFIGFFEHIDSISDLRTFPVSGYVASNTAFIQTSQVENPAPMAVYHTARWGPCTYTIPGLTPGAPYLVTLHFVETYWTKPGQRRFNVTINDVRVLTNFDILATAGGQNIAITQRFSTYANREGQVILQFTNGSVDLPVIHGIQIVEERHSLGSKSLTLHADGFAAAP